MIKIRNKKSRFSLRKTAFTKWAMMGSNHRPKDYESSTLTN